MRNRNSQGLSGVVKSKQSLDSGPVALRQLNPIHNKVLKIFQITEKLKISQTFTLVSWKCKSSNIQSHQCYILIQNLSSSTFIRFKRQNATKSRNMLTRILILSWLTCLIFAKTSFILHEGFHTSWYIPKQYNKFQNSSPSIYRYIYLSNTQLKTLLFATFSTQFFSQVSGMVMKDRNVTLITITKMPH